MSDPIKDYARAVGEAVRDECAKVESMEWVDLDAIIASVPKPEAQRHDSPTCNVDPEEVRRALQHWDRGMDSVWPPTNKVLIEAAREWLASLPPNTTTPAPTCDEPRVIESVTWCLYPVGDGTLWAISHRRTGGLVEGASSAEMRELRQMLPPDTTTAAPDVQQRVAPLADVLQVAMCPTCKVRWATCRCALTPEEQQSAPDVQAQVDAAVDGAHPWTPVAGRRGGEICDVCKWAREGHDELKINRLASAVIAAARMHTHHPHARSARCDICTVIDQYDRARSGAKE